MPGKCGIRIYAICRTDRRRWRPSPQRTRWEGPRSKVSANAVNPLAVALTLAAVHFGAPLAYYVEAKRWLKRPWDVKRDLQHTPTVTVAILTYNEGQTRRGQTGGHLQTGLSPRQSRDYRRRLGQHRRHCGEGQEVDNCALCSQTI